MREGAFERAPAGRIRLRAVRVKMCNTFRREDQTLPAVPRALASNQRAFGTLFEPSPLSLTIWFLVLYMLTHAKTNVSGL